MCILYIWVEVTVDGLGYNFLNIFRLRMILETETLTRDTEDRWCQGSAKRYGGLVVADISNLWVTSADIDDRRIVELDSDDNRDHLCNLRIVGIGLNGTEVATIDSNNSEGVPSY